MIGEMNKLVRLLSDLEGENCTVSVIGHPQADPDAVSSVIGLSEILEFLGCEVKSGIPQGLNKLSGKILSYLDMEVYLDPILEGDYIFVLDTSSLGLLENYSDKVLDMGAEIVFIDHHRPEEETLETIDYYFGDEGITSNAEIIIELEKRFNCEFDSKTSFLLLSGIISDTAHLRHANEGTFRAISYLLSKGVDYQEVLNVLETPKDPSKRVAILKAIDRSELIKADGNWIVLSEVGAYESDAASLFVNVGADVSLVISESDEGVVRISSRCKNEIVSDKGLHLGELMSEIAEEFDGTGGGHEGAAGMNAEADLEEVKEMTVGALKNKLK